MMFNMSTLISQLKTSRVQFIALSAVLTGAVIFFPSFPAAWRLGALFLLPLVCLLAVRFILGSFSVLPVAFTLGILLTLLYFPNFSLIFRSLLSIFFGVGFYITLLAENIFRAAQERSIPLLRPAQTASFLLTLFTAFLLFTALYKFHLPMPVGLAAIFLTAFFLAYQNLQSINLPRSLSRSILVPGLILGLGVVEVGLCISFVPVESFFRALVLSTSFYIFLGVTQQWLRHTLRSRTLREYVLVALVVAFVTFIFG